MSYQGFSSVVKNNSNNNVLKNADIIDTYDISTTDHTIVDQIKHHSTNIINILNETCITNEKVYTINENIFVTPNIHKHINTMNNSNTLRTHFDTISKQLQSYSTR